MSASGTTRRVRLLIGGDLAPVGRGEALFAGGEAEVICRDLLPDFRRADAVVVNLETPFVDQSRPILKTGPALRSSSATFKGVSAMGVKAATLANNHILDQGAAGLLATMELCRRDGILCFGAGRDRAAAQTIRTLEAGGVKIGLMGMTEWEWSIAGEEEPGAARLDPIAFVRQVAARQADYDVLVVLAHGGVEMYPYPTPGQQELSRFFVEQGAAAVVWQHSHVAGCCESRGDALIAYGQGNLVMDGGRPPGDPFNRGLLLELELSPRGLEGHRWIPYSQFDGHDGLRRLDGESARRFMSAFEERSAEAANPVRIRERWQEFCRTQKDGLWRTVRGYRRWLAAVVRRLRLEPVIHSEQHALQMLNLVRCESHRERLLEILAQDISGPRPGR